MKTYELKIFNNSGKDVVGLDLREILIKTPYKIFNEENSEETFYFQRNGDLVQSISGMTTTSQWKILDGSNILHIVNDEQKNGTLLRFIHKIGGILVFQLDYTNHYVFLLDRNDEYLCTIRLFSVLLRFLIQKIYLCMQNLDVNLDLSYTYNKEITSIYIPYGIKELPVAAFKGCSKLVNVYLPETIIKIGDEAFYDCNELLEVIVPEGVDVLSKSMFKGCYNVRNFNLYMENLPF